ncbi:methyl-accepting chemotaxis protein, partial [Pseudomonas frederiksbergensis]|nr:methyl-accepting chemotaxis protein [Pseudomonas frederiksbergensis]
IENSTVPSITNLDQLTQLTLRLRTLSYRLLLNREADTLQATLKLVDQRNQQIDDARRVYEPLISGSQERAAYNQYVQLLSQYRQLENRMRLASQNNDLDSLRNL